MDPDQIVSPPFDFMRITSALLPHIGLPWHSLRSWGTAIWIDMSLFIQLPVLHGILPPSLSGKNDADEQSRGIQPPKPT